jgi:uncharacterized paraquat-inducible protein A
LAFAAAVVLTILATDSFDPQLIWAEPKPSNPPPVQSPTSA